MDSSQMARKSPIVTAGWIRRVSAPVPSEVAIDPRRIHAHIWIPADSQPWIGRFNNDNIFHLILLSCLHTWFSFAKIYLLWYKIQNNIFFHQRDTHSLSPAGLGCRGDDRVAPSTRSRSQSERTKSMRVL